MSPDTKNSRQLKAWVVLRPANNERDASAIAPTGQPESNARVGTAVHKRLQAMLIASPPSPTAIESRTCMPVLREPFLTRIFGGLPRERKQRLRR
jgi:hypothetical protein